CLEPPHKRLAVNLSNFRNHDCESPLPLRGRAGQGIRPLRSKTHTPNIALRRRSMAKDKMDFAQQNTERAMQGTNWMRAIAEQNLNQGKAAFEGFLTVARDALRGVDQQAAGICEHSFSCSQNKRWQIRSTLLTSSFV